jgi:hypothetical protein
MGGALTTPAAELFKVYAEYSKTLRTWLVAYGIGAPVLFLTNETLARTFVKSAQARTVAFYFLAGVVLQVFLALLNKNVMWVCYYAEDSLVFKTKQARAVRCADWISRQCWFDLLLDVGTMFLFANATRLAFQILVAPGA